MFKSYVVTAILIALFIATTPTWATRDDQTWTVITATGTVNKKYKKVKYWLEAQGRFGEHNRRLSQGIIRPALGYFFKDSTSLWLGYAWVNTEPPFNRPRRRFDENRIWQQLLWTHTFYPFDFISRTRLEERFIQHTNTTWRFRQQFKILLPLSKESKFALVSSDEGFWHLNNFNELNNRGFDQNRYFIGFAYKFNAEASTEIGYLNQYIRRVGTTNFQANIIFLQLLFSY